MYNILNLMQLEKNFQKKLLDQFTGELSGLPKGNLYIQTIKNRQYPCHQWSEEVGNGSIKQHRRLLAPQETELTMEIKRRQFIKKGIPILNGNVKALTDCIDKYQEYDPQVICESLGAAYQSIPDLKNAGERRGEEELWELLQEGSNLLHQENLIHSIGERKVRSKSEMIIAMQLKEHGIPFKYEVKLQKGGITLCPDFVPFNCVQKKVFYWEHFGKTGDNGYVENSERKLGQYRKIGITPWDNLIITFDKPDGSLDAVQIEKIIKLFLSE